MKKVTRLLDRIEAWLQSLPWDTGEDDFARNHVPAEQRTPAQQIDDDARPQGLYGALCAQYSPDRVRTQTGLQDY